MNNKLKTLIKITIYLTPVILCSLDAYGAGFDFDKAKAASLDPIKKFINDTYPIGIFLSGVVGLFLNREGDLRDKAFGLGKGVAAGALIVAAAKAGLDI